MAQVALPRLPTRLSLVLPDAAFELHQQLKPSDSLSFEATTAEETGLVITMKKQANLHTCLEIQTNNEGSVLQLADGQWLCCVKEITSEVLLTASQPSEPAADVKPVIDASSDSALLQMLQPQEPTPDLIAPHRIKTEKDPDDVMQLKLEASLEQPHHSEDALTLTIQPQPDPPTPVHLVAHGGGISSGDNSKAVSLATEDEDTIEDGTGENTDDSVLNASQQSEQTVVSIGMAESTADKITWALDLFNKWRKNRNEANIDSTNLESFVPAFDIEYFTSEELDINLEKFIAEIRKKKDGKPYPGKTLREIITCIQMHLDRQGFPRKLFDADKFPYLNNSLTSLIDQQTKDGMYSERKIATQLTTEQEEILWEKQILGSDTPDKLVKTLFFLNGLHFAFRGGGEHRDLCVGANSQFKVRIDSETGKKYLEYTAKNVPNRSKNSKNDPPAPRCLKAYCVANDERCIVCLYERYISLRPDKPPDFYLYGCKFPKKKGWFTQKPVGIHALQHIIQNLCKEAGFEGRFTNHSLREMAIARKYGVQGRDELMKELRWYKSNTVRSLLKTADTKKRRISDVSSSNEDENEGGPAKKPAQDSDSADL